MFHFCVTICPLPFTVMVERRVCLYLLAYMQWHKWQPHSHQTLLSLWYWERWLLLLPGLHIQLDTHYVSQGTFSGNKILSKIIWYFTWFYNNDLFNLFFALFSFSLTHCVYINIQVLCSLASAITIMCSHFCGGIHFLLGHAYGGEICQRPGGLLFL